MLFLFQALAHIQATLKSLKTIIWGRWSKVHSVSDITERERASHRDRHRVRGGERHQGREVSWMRYRARRGETETNRSSARLPALTSQLQPVRHVIRGDVFGFTETKASSPSDVIQRGRLSI